ncbi:hypothetical protein [Arthrobacter luteolus]|uniref:hypothetical protein n=1 Tax=Arthrobacter luteolus TaxID=98672 RepID=UPI00384C95A1
MAESEYARNMRQQAELQTRLAHQTLEEAQRQTHFTQQQYENSAMLLQQQEIDAARLLEAQEELAESQRDHNFAMWRSTTDSGRAYAEWSHQARPLVTDFDARGNLWRAALQKDVESVRSRRESLAITLFDLKAARFRTVARRQEATFRGLIGTLGLGLLATIILSPVLGLLAGILNSIWSIEIFSQDYSLRLVMVQTPIAIFVIFTLWEVIFQFPRARQLTAKRRQSRVWIEAEVEKFSSQLPTRWLDYADSDAWNQLVEAKNVIKWMPSAYVDYDYFDPPTLPDRLPKALSAEMLPKEADAARSLLLSW